MRRFTDTAALLSRSKFAHSVALVASGTAGAQAIALAFAPLITRLYGPEAYGLLGTFSAMVAVIAPVTALTYPIAIVLPRDNADARGLVRLAFMVSTVVAVLAFGVFAVAGDAILSSVGAGEIAAFALLVPAVIMFSAWLQIAQQWLIRHRAFKITARVAIAQALILNIAIALGGLVYPVAAVIIALQAAGVALHATLLGIASRALGIGQESEVEGRRSADLATLARRHQDFPLYRAPQIFINTASQSLPVLALASLFGPAAAGLYALARNVLVLPSGLVTQSVSMVLYPQIAEARHQGESCYRLVLNATVALAVVGMVPFGAIVAFGPWLFGMVFGTEWSTAGEYARWLALMYFFGFLNGPSVAAVPVLGLQRGLLIYEVFSTGTKLLALFIGLVVYANDQVAVALFAIFGAGAYIALIAWVMLAARKFGSEVQYAEQAS